MYKILIVSDSHGRKGQIMDLIDRITDLNHIFHLGDVVSDAIDLESISGLLVDYVAGNCDFNDMITPENKVVEILGKRFYLTHGHNERVKYSLKKLERLAKKEKFDGIFFGHTHEPYMEYYGETLIMNPGSISLPRNGKLPSYSIIQIDDKGRVHGTLNDYKNSSEKNF